MQQPLSDLPPHSDNVDEEMSRIELALDTVFSPTAANPNPSQIRGGRRKDFIANQEKYVDDMFPDRNLAPDHREDALSEVVLQESDHTTVTEPAEEEHLQQKEAAQD